MQDIFVNLVNDASNQIKNEAKPFQRPFIFAKMFTEQVKMLYDTGPNISAVNENIFRKISVYQRPSKIEETSNRQFCSAGGQNLQIKGKFLLPVTIGKKIVQHPFYVIKNLSEAAIMGINFIQQHTLNYCPDQRSFSWKGGSFWHEGSVKLCSLETIPPLSIGQIKVNLTTEAGCSPKADSICYVNIAVSDIPILTGGPAMVQPDQSGQAFPQIANRSPNPTTLQRGEFMGFIENVTDCEKRHINPSYINKIALSNSKNCVPIPLSKEKKLFIQEKVKLKVPEEFKYEYLKVLFKNHEAFSEHKYDLGQTETLIHDISQKSEEPVYVKQFKIPDAHREQIEKHMTEWLKLGVVQPSRSIFNSPIFFVAKKNGGLQLVQDFWALNAQTHTDKYSMKDVSECIGEISRSGSTIFQPSTSLQDSGKCCSSPSHDHTQPLTFLASANLNGSLPQWAFLVHLRASSASWRPSLPASPTSLCTSTTYSSTHHSIRTTSANLMYFSLASSHMESKSIWTNAFSAARTSPTSASALPNWALNLVWTSSRPSPQPNLPQTSMKSVNSLAFATFFAPMLKTLHKFQAICQRSLKRNRPGNLDLFPQKLSKLFMNSKLVCALNQSSIILIATGRTPSSLTPPSETTLTPAASAPSYHK
jgi:hypothetical protein